MADKKKSGKDKITDQGNSDAPKVDQTETPGTGPVIIEGTATELDAAEKVASEETVKTDSGADTDDEAVDRIVPAPDAPQDDEPSDPPETAESETVADETAADDLAGGAQNTGAPVMPVPTEKVIERVVERRRGGFPALIGGVLAAALGFAAGRTEVIDPYLPEALRSGNDDAVLMALEQRLATQEDTIDALRGDLGALEIPDTGPLSAAQQETDAQLATLAANIAAMQEPFGALGSGLGSAENRINEAEGRVTGTESAISAAVATLETLTGRLTTLEKRPITESLSKEAIAAYEREVAGLQAQIADQRADLQSSLQEQAAALQSSLETQRTSLEQAITAQREEIERMIENARVMERSAAEQGRKAAARAALADLQVALSNGEALSAPLSALSQSGVDAPAPLSALADNGVETLTVLQADFPDPARAALRAARSEQTQDEGVGGFFRRQLGARSVAPREGSSADAILSRADAAVKAGDLAMALDEISTLPAPAMDALSDWSERARTRLDALQSADDLAQRLSSN